MPKRSTRGSTTQGSMKSSGRVAVESTSSPPGTARPGGSSRPTMRSFFASMGTISRRRPWTSSNSLSFRSRFSHTWTRGGEQQARRVVRLESGQVGHVAGAVQEVARVVARIALEEVDHGGAQARVRRELLDVPAGQVVEPLAQVAAVDAERAGEVAAELGQVAADVVLGEAGGRCRAGGSAGAGTAPPRPPRWRRRGAARGRRWWRGCGRGAGRGCGT